MSLTNKEINDLINLEPYCSKIKSWRQSVVKLEELKMTYQLKADWFEKNHGYRTAFFEALLNALSTVDDSEFVYMLSIDFEDGDNGFGIVDQKKILFFSGPLKQIKQNWGD